MVAGIDSNEQPGKKPAGTAITEDGDQDYRSKMKDKLEDRRGERNDLTVEQPPSREI